MARIIIAIDAEGESVEKTYRKIFNFMKSLPQDMSWESTDEAFEDDGTEVTPEDIQEARMRCFADQYQTDWVNSGLLEQAMDLLHKVHDTALEDRDYHEIKDLLEEYGAI
jgi:hypothetical protein